MRINVRTSAPNRELWTFRGEVRAQHSVGAQYGKYANDSYWIAGSITETFPPETTGDMVLEDATVLEDQFLHGAQVNPGEGSSNQAYHGPIFLTPTALSNLGFNAGLQATYPVEADKSLVKAKGLTEDVSTELRPALKYLSVYTVVSAPPPDGSIRPGISDLDKTPKLNTSTLDISPLRDLDPTANNIPTLSFEQALARSTWKVTEQRAFNAQSRNIVPVNDGLSSPYYGDIGEEYVEVMLAMHTNQFTAEQKKTLAIRLAVIAVDIAAKRYNGGIWTANGGHSGGRVSVLSFVAELFDSDYLRDIILDVGDTTISDVIDAGKSVWGDLNQVYEITEEIVEATADATLPNERPIPLETLWFPEWDSAHGAGKTGGPLTRHPLGWADEPKNSYRFITSGHYIGGSLALRLMQGVTPVMPQRFHDYADRLAEFIENDLYVGNNAPLFKQTVNLPPAFITDYYHELKSLVDTWTPPVYEEFSESGPGLGSAPGWRIWIESASEWQTVTQAGLTPVYDGSGLNRIRFENFASTADAAAAKYRYETQITDIGPYQPNNFEGNSGDIQPNYFLHPFDPEPLNPTLPGWSLVGTDYNNPVETT